jgi:tRNA modification GTPase
MREGLHKIIAGDDTIVAIATPFGRSGIGVIRISGPSAKSIVDRFFTAAASLSHKQVVIGQWLDSSGNPMDDVLVTLFRSPHSYTGEDLLEISAHGNPLILNQIVQTIQTAGSRIAAPGEFTLRAVANGKMDLLQAEAVRDFIEAQTDAQARSALRQMEGALSRHLGPIKNQLVDLIAHLEASIDFSDDDVEPADTAKIARGVGKVKASLDELQSTYNYGRILSHGIRVVIVGKPNVGKSSLFNRLVSLERAIVTDVPGTTRDVLSEVVDFEGVPLRFFDTAGLRETTDRVERIGISRTTETLTEAELAVVVVDGSQPFTDEDLAVLARTVEVPRIVVLNKCDLTAQGGAAVLEASPKIQVSAKTGEGLDVLRSTIKDFLSRDRAVGVSESILTSARQNDAVIRALVSLEKSALALGADVPQEMVALDLYEALSALNELTGDTVTEDILGRIFSSFCVGK